MRTVAHGDSDVGAGQGWRVVDTISNESHRLAAIAIELDFLTFFLGSLLRVPSLDMKRLGDGSNGGGLIPREDGGAKSKLTERCDRRLALWFERVVDTQGTENLLALGQPTDTQSLCGQFAVELVRLQVGQTLLLHPGVGPKSKFPPVAELNTHTLTRHGLAFDCKSFRSKLQSRLTNCDGYRMIR